MWFQITLTRATSKRNISVDDSRYTNRSERTEERLFDDLRFCSLSPFAQSSPKVSLDTFQEMEIVKKIEYICNKIIDDMASY